MSNNKKANKAPRQGIDVLLQRKGKSLQTGQKISFTLVKGPSINRDAIPDPVNPLAPKECFPLIAKFPESVVKPEFSQAPWNNARLYQQDVPKAQIESDEEAEEQQAIEAKKRWRRKRNEPPKRQWVLQEQVEFLETMMAKRQKKSDIYPAGKISSRYEGMPEHNPSHYVLLECRTNGAGSNGNTDHNIQVTLLPAPPNANVTFAQPAARKTLTMSEAEQAIQDQRNNMTRYMMHNKQQNSFLNQAAKPVNQSKARLLGKLAKVSQKGAEVGDNDETDDIMADVAFRDRKGNAKARKDLLNSLGDEGVKVDDDGVLGGAHDDEFGGKRRFGAFKAAEEDKAKAQAGGDKAQGNDGMAMADGFFQRDVKAEYDELDYDVEEQFDDDDVDVGETEVVVEGGFTQEEDDEEEAEEAEEGGNEVISGAEGLASVAGFKAMLAKAKSGESTDPNQPAEAANATANGTEATKKDPIKDLVKGKNIKKLSRSEQEQNRRLDSIFRPQEPTREEKVREETKTETKVDGPDEPDEKIGPDGLRVISLKAVRREIWLNHGQIPMKRLMKLFDIKKKSSQERQQKFREVVKELCTMRTDPVGGRMLVLKQHYSNMG